ncbi:MAG TPA: hypothetical protein PK631_06050 [Erysipelotrichaceae bacterium]|nr:hypothetical protein [Erysipelotrichaceae bacterium]
MNDSLKIMIVMIVLSIVITIITKYITVKLERQLIDRIVKKDYQGFDELIKSKKVRYLIKPFNVDFMKLNVAILKEDKKQTDEMFDYFDTVKPSRLQKEAVYTKGFYYYLTNERYDKVEKYYNLLQTVQTKKPNFEVERAYDVFVKNGHQYLEQTLEELKAAEDFAKPVLEGLIARMYENKKDSRMAKKYADQAMRHMEELK